MTYSRVVNASKHNHDADLNIKKKARELRRNLTPSEKILWKVIRNGQINGMHFRKQHPFGIYILDYYCYKANLVIEIDGKIHLKRKKYDYERTEYLKCTGLKVLRFQNEDVVNRLEWVIKEIKSKLEE
jgi:very-short-patch-repair endonuclease